MQLSSERFLPATPEQVWAALNDTAVLQRCIPGCQELVTASADELHAKVKVKVGPIAATFGGKVTLHDRQPPHGYRMLFSGDGAGGFARGSAVVRLAPLDGGTRLFYETEISIGGKLAQVGSRLIDGFAKSNIEDFFATFALTFPEASSITPDSQQEVMSTLEVPGRGLSTAWPWLLALAGSALFLGWRIFVHP